MHEKKLISSGLNIKDASKALVMIHGRGGSAKDILTLAVHLNLKEYALLAPQATNYTWYPNSFMASPADNEPWLTSALDMLKETLDDIKSHGIKSENLYFAGFSQGACLALEFVARNADRYGGVAAFTGGLIGDKLQVENYKGNFNKTPFFIGTGDPDPHVPVQRVTETKQILEKMNADVTLEIYKNRPHTITPDEIEMAKMLIFK